MKKLLKKILSQNTIRRGHKYQAIFANYWHGLPSRKLKVIGVTGTNGKTTTCNLIAKIFEEAGYKVGLATTINFKIGKKEWVNESKMTTIGVFELQKLLRDFVNAGCHYAIIETTSHAIDQFRTWGIKYEVAALTNITHDHLDYHGTFENYRDAKLKLFLNAKKAILNSDDKAYSYFEKNIVNKPMLSYGLYEKADITARKIMYETDSTLFTAVTPKGQVAIDLKLPGKFNVYNALCAIGVSLAQEIQLDVIKSALEKVHTIPGRMEKIDISDKNYKQDFTVIIDYAHTPDAIEKIYQTLTPIAKGKIIHVFGACGDRDRTKRPIMGAQAGRYADYIILTNEDPYTEDPQIIIEEVAKGVPRGATKENPKKLGKNFFKILNRKEAIAKAIALAQKDDLILITGKGAERCIVSGDKKIPWSDKETVIELLKMRIKK